MKIAAVNRLFSTGSFIRTCLLFLSVFPFPFGKCQTSNPNFTEISGSKPGILLEVRYFGSDNFTGRPVPGYRAPHIYLTNQAADSLKKVVRVLANKNLGIKIFDGYRPQTAVDGFVKWAKGLNDTIRKREYYPEVDKSELFRKGYIAARSGHSRGSTVDLTLIKLDTGKELEMGTSFDYFGPESHPFYPAISERAKANRNMLRQAMVACGFIPLETEWWHFTLAEEPYPDTYFDFDIR